MQNVPTPVLALNAMTANTVSPVVTPAIVLPPGDLRRDEVQRGLQQLFSAFDHCVAQDHESRDMSRREAVRRLGEQLLGESVEFFEFT